MRCWQLASKMKKVRGPLDGDSKYDDNNRIKRYVAKYTINPAICNGISDYVGSIEVGKYADLNIWDPKYFGTKPDMVIKNGMITYGIAGDPSSSLPTPEPVLERFLYGAEGRAVNHTCVTYVSQYAYDHGIKEQLGLNKTILPVHNTRSLTKANMKLNNYTPKTIEIDPQTYDVKIDGKLITCDAAPTLPLTQRYYLY